MMTPRPADTVPVRIASGRLLGALAGMATALVLLGLSACGVDRRSDEYRCNNPSDCPSRQCEDGWCVFVPVEEDAAPSVLPDAMVTPVPIDAAPDPDDCPAVCSACDDGTCHIACDSPGSCQALVVCPAGWACDVECLGLQSCTAGVRCGSASSCTVRCEGSAACMGGVICGAGACDVECAGLSACLSIDCRESCACDTSCEDGALCTLQCPDRGGNCRRNGECSSNSCDTCS